MKNALLILFIANLLLGAAALCILPDTVAIHFGLGGKAGGWASKEFNFILFALIELMVFAIFNYSHLLLYKTPKKYINLPNKEYWLRPENLPVAVERFGSVMREYGSALMLFFLVIFALTIHANLSDPVILNERLFFAALILYLLYTVYWVIKLIRMFRQES